ncbi:MAG: hypothetical protein IJX88_00915 [Clostridia bacterium]|nr:hypothetical protein [Clostridia bacterium]
MNGWLCYDRLGAKKNEWFINRLQEEAAKRGISLTLRIVEKGDFAKTLPSNLPEFAVVRFICPTLNEWLQERGVRVFNNAQTAATACDKWHTYEFQRVHGIPVLQTYRFGEGTLPFPFVAKSRFGHGGSEVFWVENEHDLQQVRQTLQDDFLLQRPCGNLGKDMRIYAVGGKIVASVLRESDKDFRSNFSLGGRVRLAEADETQKSIVEKIYKALRFDFIGIDFLPDKNGWIVNELEDAAGARMLYAVSDIDMATVMTEHIAQNIRKY